MAAAELANPPTVALLHVPLRLACPPTAAWLCPSLRRTSIRKWAEKLDWQFRGLDGLARTEACLSDHGCYLAANLPDSTDQRRDGPRFVEPPLGRADIHGARKRWVDAREIVPTADPDGSAETFLWPSPMQSGEWACELGSRRLAIWVVGCPDRRTGGPARQEGYRPGRRVGRGWR